MKKRYCAVTFAVLALAIILNKPEKVSAADVIYTNVEGVAISNDYTGWAKKQGDKAGKYWFDKGVMATDKEVYDPETDAWYWFDLDGKMAVNKDVFIPDSKEDTESGKWVRYDKNGYMIKGEDYRYDGWYYFDLITGEMLKGFVYIPNEDDGKWVYYDEIDGQMHHGESCINDNWYRFDDYTGKMVHGEYYNGESWYYYDSVSGIMQKGFVDLYNEEYQSRRVYYDMITGIMKYGEMAIGDDWYRFDIYNGNMIRGEFYNGKDWYYYNDNGVMQKGIVYHHDNEYYYDPITGIMQKGIVSRDGAFYKYDLWTGVYICKYNKITCWGDSMVQGVGTGAGYIFTDDGIIDISYNTFPSALEKLTGIQTFNYGVGGEISIAIMNREMDYYDSPCPDDIVIFEIGSNGGWDGDYDELVEQYRNMINSAGTDYYIIVGDTDDPGTSPACNQDKYDEDGNYLGTNDTDWEAALREAFGEHFINTRVYMIENGLSDCHLTPDEEDEENQAMGRISKKLRADWTHFNAYGYYSKAIGVYKKGQELGYWY